MRKTVGLFVIFLFGGVWLESAQATIARGGGGLQSHVQNRSASADRRNVNKGTVNSGTVNGTRALSTPALSIGAPSEAAV